MAGKINMKILIVGSDNGVDSTVYALAKKLSQSEKVKEVFVTGEIADSSEFSTNVDVKPSDIKGLVEFVKSKEVDLTIVTAEDVIALDVAKEFEANGLDIFCPTANAARIAISKSSAKKFMYKTKIFTPKFGIFDKESIAVDYVRKSPYPLVIKPDTHNASERAVICRTFRHAKSVVEDLFETKNKKIVVENYVLGKEFSFYIITDGHSAVPITSVIPYKFSKDGEAGVVTKGLGAVAPCYSLGSKVEKLIAEKIIYPALDELNKNGTPYCGILGADIVVDRTGRLWTLEFNTFFNEPDAAAVLALLDDDLVNLIKATLAGSLGDDYQEITLKNAYAASAVVTCPDENLVGKEIKSLDGLDSDVEISHISTKCKINAEKDGEKTFYTNGERSFVVTKTASTLLEAREGLYENLALIEQEGKKYLNDIGKVTSEIF